MSGDTSTGQLDFYEAMQDFTQMFPYMDCEVIEAVLRANNGAVDSTIDQLLTMNQGEDRGKTNTDKPPAVTVKDTAQKRTESSSDYVNTEILDIPPALPPKQKRSPKKTTFATHTHMAQTPQHDLDTDSNDLMDASISDIMNLPPAPPRPKFNPNSPTFKTPAQPIPHFRHGVPDAPVARNRVPMEEKTKGHRCRSKSTPLEFYKKSLKPVNLYAKWKPALLGELPEDFLRLDISPKPEESHDQKVTVFDLEEPRHRRRHTVGHKSLPLLHGNSHHSNSTTRKISEHPSNVSELSGMRPKIKQTPQADMRHKLRVEKTGSLPSSHNKTQARLAERKLHLARHREHATLQDVGRSTSVQSQQQAQNMEWLLQKLAENERRRCEVEEGDVETAQYLQDEYLALMLQNSEFLEELTRDTDFMQTLDRDSRRVGSAQDIVPSPIPHVSAPRSTPTQYSQDPQLDVDMIGPEDVEGYGEDKQTELPAFPHDCDWPEKSHDKTPKSQDQHLELRKRLETMGSSSKKKFLDIARRFFSLKKKQPSKPLYKNMHTPSTMNLLLEEEVPESSLPQNSI